jgi:hypothetical protein
MILNDGDFRLISGDGRIRDPAGIPDHIRRVRRVDDGARVSHPYFKCMRCKIGMRVDSIDVGHFASQHLNCRPTVQQTMDRYVVPLDEQMATLRGEVIDLLLAEISMFNISFRAAGCLEFFSPLWGAIRLGQAFPNVRPEVLLPMISRQKWSRRMVAAVENRLQRVWDPFVAIGHCAIICDSVTIWDNQRLIVTAVNALHAIEPELVSITEHFGGCADDYAAAVGAACADMCEKEVDVDGFVFDLLQAQATVLDPTSRRCFYAEIDWLRGARGGGCACHGAQRAILAAGRACEAISRCLSCLDLVSAFMNTKIVSAVVGRHVATSVATRWGNKLQTSADFACHRADFASRLSSAILSGEIDPRLLRKVFKVDDLCRVRDISLHGCVLYLVAVAPWIDASTNWESNKCTIGEVLPLLDRAYAASVDYAVLVQSMGYDFDLGLCDIVRGCFFERFYCGRYRQIYLVAAVLTLAGREQLRMRLGLKAFDTSNTVANKYRASPTTTKAFEALVQQTTDDISVMEEQFDVAIRHVSETRHGDDAFWADVDFGVDGLEEEEEEPQVFDSDQEAVLEAVAEAFVAEHEATAGANVVEAILQADMNEEPREEEEEAEILLRAGAQADGLPLHLDVDDSEDEPAREEEFPAGTDIDRATDGRTCLEEAAEHAAAIAEMHARRPARQRGQQINADSPPTAVPVEEAAPRARASRFQPQHQTPMGVADAVRAWVVTDMPRSLLERLAALSHLDLWATLEEEYDWGSPLRELAEVVLCMPASEAHSERTVKQVRRVLGRHAARTGTEVLVTRTRMAMSAELRRPGEG